MTLETIQPWLNFVHPVTMWLLLAITLYALYLGVQSRRTRLGDAETRKELIKGKFATSTTRSALCCWPLW
jgi:hypothetical protein